MNSISIRSKAGYILGIFILLFFIIYPIPGSLNPKGWWVAMVGCLMANFWITESIPIPITALFPLGFFPLLGVGEIGEVAKGFSNPLLFLFMGGFFLALAMERWNLHRRMALNVLKIVGTSPRQLVYGFFCATALISMWVNNTSTSMMMLPIGISVIHFMEEEKILGDPESERHFGVCVLLSIAYAASIGGICTIIGTTPNIFMVGFVKETLNVQIDFLSWMKLGIPLFLLSVPIVPYLLLRVFPVRTQPDHIPEKKFFESEIQKLGNWNRGEKYVLSVFFLVVTLWITQPLWKVFFPVLTDASIAILGALSLFFLPVDLKQNTFVLDWETGKRIPWDALLLFGGGLSLAGQVEKSRLAEWIGSGLSFLQDFPVFFLVFLVVITIIFLTELTSNIATTAAFLPILSALAKGIGQDPLLFIIPATIAASCAFMLPVATPPNTIVYASGRIKIQDMTRIGLLLNFVFTGLILIIFFLFGNIL